MEPINTSRSDNNNGNIMAIIIDLDIIGLVAKCNEALASVRRSRQVAIPNRRPSSVREELLNTLQGGSKKRKWKRKKNTWKHKFMCLAYLG